jgi:hypothetical protein
VRNLREWTRRKRVIVSPKGHVKDAPNSTPKPTTTPKPPLPPLKDAAKTEPSTAQQKPEIKPAEKPEIAPAKLTAMPVLAPQSTPAKPEPPTATATTKKPLMKKLSRKGDILKALRVGGTLTHTAEGLYRITNVDRSENRVSKRRAASFVSQGLLKLTKTDAVGKHYLLDPDAEKKAEEKPALKGESSQRAV